MSVTWAPQARVDLRDALAFLHERTPTAAEALRSAVFRVIGMLDARVMDGPFARLRSNRKALRVHVRPLWIFYERTPTGDVRILRLYHHARRPLR